MTIGSAGQLNRPTPVPAEEIETVVHAAARAHATPARWLSQGNIRRRMAVTKGEFARGFYAALNLGFLENRPIGAVITPNSSSVESYRLTDAGWHIAGGKPLWL